MKRLLFLTLLLSLISWTVKAQKLPTLDDKPEPQYPKHYFCPPKGKIDSSHADPDLNLAKNRIDDNEEYFDVDFAEIQRLDNSDLGGRKRSDLENNERKAIEKKEGIPVRVEGFLALVNNGRKGKPLMQGARPEGKESCNCGSEDANRIDFHLWLLPEPDDSRANAVVVEMTPRVRGKHPRWVVKDLTFIAAKQFPVRVSGWLMFDGQHPEQLEKTRATLWEVHPIIKFEYKQNGVWKVL